MPLAYTLQSRSGRMQIGKVHVQHGHKTNYLCQKCNSSSHAQGVKEHMNPQNVYQATLHTTSRYDYSIRPGPWDMR